MHVGVRVFIAIFMIAPSPSPIRMYDPLKFIHLSGNILSGVTAPVQKEKKEKKGEWGRVGGGQKFMVED